MNDLALVIHAIVNAEELCEVIIVGHSMGGYVALAFANAYPAFVRGISLVHSAAWPDSPEKKDNRKRTAEIILNGAKQAFIKQMVPNLFAPDFVSFYPNIISEQIAVATGYEPSELANFQLAMMNRRDSLPYITNSTIPIQWILGKKDNLIPYQQALTQIYKAQINFISSYNNCGHMAMLENPEFLSKDILNFSNYCLNHRH
jgi:pimeloyl-ACP methyl ester carboxylesterase